MSQIKDPNHPKILFLIDGIGAAVSAAFLGIGLVVFNEFIGMSIHILKLLATIALILSIYSMSRFFMVRSNWSPRLRTIAILNFFYCCLTIIMVLLHLNQVTLWGIAYFVIEVMIIIILARKEWMTADTFENL